MQILGGYPTLEFANNGTVNIGNVVLRFELNRSPAINFIALSFLKRVQSNFIRDACVPDARHRDRLNAFVPENRRTA